MSIAVRRGDAPPLVHEGAGGALASASLIPTIQGLLGRAGLRLQELDVIVFGRGPGSFTGLRTACSVAQGLAFGAGTPVLPVDTLLAVAEEARAKAGYERVIAVLDARMDEVYSAAYVHDNGSWRQEGDFAVGKPESVGLPDGWAMAGNAFAAYGERLPAGGPRTVTLPTAAALLRLAPAMVHGGLAVSAAQALPLYIRDKVAQTTAERAAIRAGQPLRP